MDLAKLVSLVTSRAAAGVAVVAVTAGAGGAVALTSNPASSHQSQGQTVLTVEPNSESSSGATPESAETPEPAETPESAETSTTNHGDVVTRAVSSCKASASAAHEHGIGECVSDVASSNGETHRHTESHATSENTTSH